MIVIRFFRVGKRNQPSFKVVVTDKKHSVKNSRFVEAVGFYNPLTKKGELKKERVKYWLEKGAQPSSTVYNLLVKEKIIEGKKIPKHKKSKKPVGEKPAGEAPKKEEIKEKELEEASKEPVSVPVDTATKAEPINNVEEKTSEHPKEEKPAPAA